MYFGPGTTSVSRFSAGSCARGLSPTRAKCPPFSQWLSPAANCARGTLCPDAHTAPGIGARRNTLSPGTSPLWLRVPGYGNTLRTCTQTPGRETRAQEASKEFALGSFRPGLPRTAHHNGVLPEPGPGRCIHVRIYALGCRASTHIKEVPSVEDMIISVLAFLVLVSAGFAVLAVLVGALGVLTGSRFERCPRCQRLGLMNDRWPQHRSCSPRKLLGGSNGLNSPPEASHL